VFVAVDRPFVGTPGKSGVGNIHIVRRAAHETDGVFGNELEASMTLGKVLTRARNHVADIDRLTGLRVGHQADVCRLMLEIEDLGQRPRGARKRRMSSYVADLFTIDPDLARTFQPRQEFLAGSCSHMTSLDLELRKISAGGLMMYQHRRAGVRFPSIAVAAKGLAASPTPLDNVDRAQFRLCSLLMRRYRDVKREQRTPDPPRPLVAEGSPAAGERVPFRNHHDARVSVLDRSFDTVSHSVRLSPQGPTRRRQSLLESRVWRVTSQSA